MKSTNYSNAFIKVAEDCPVQKAAEPPVKEVKTIAQLQFEMIAHHPYKYTSDDVIFQSYAIKNKIEKKEWPEEKERFFSKGQACLRASPLAKRYGWGIHHNEKGQVALLAVDSPAYKKFTTDKSLKQLFAMRSKKPGSSEPGS